MCKIVSKPKARIKISSIAVILFNRSAREPKTGEVYIFGLGQLHIHKNAKDERRF